MHRPLALLLSLLFALPLMAGLDVALAANAAAPVEGADYVTIDNGAPYAPLAGRIEVVEVFGYWCPHCADFAPALSAWTRSLPADVRFTYVPAVFTAGDAFARGYFAADQFGAVGKTHDALFSAVHTEGALPANASLDEIAAWYGQHGLDASKVKATMQSPAVDAKLAYAQQFALRSGVEGTPTLIVNGRYRITARNHQDGLRVASQLIAKLRAASQPPSTPIRSRSP